MRYRSSTVIEGFNDPERRKSRSHIIPGSLILSEPERFIRGVVDGKVDLVRV